MYVEVRKIKGDGEVTSEILFTGQVMAYVAVSHVIGAVIKRDDGTFEFASLPALKETITEKEVSSDRRESGSGPIAMGRSEPVDNIGADGRVSQKSSSEKKGSRRS